MIDLSLLLEPENRPWIPAYETLEGEFRAVHERRKGLSYYLMPRAWIDESSEDYMEIVRVAGDLGLTVLLAPTTHAERDVGVYVLRLEEAWRATAHTALRATMPKYGRWSDGAEALECHLLGYSESQTEAWLEYTRWARHGWGAVTLYVLMANTLRARVHALGNRSFPPGAVGPGELIAFFPTDDRVVKKDAAGLVPDDVTIGRIALSLSCFRKNIGTPDGWENEALVSREIRDELIPVINRGLRADIELLGPDGWSR